MSNAVLQTNVFQTDFGQLLATLRNNGMQIASNDGGIIFIPGQSPLCKALADLILTTVATDHIGVLGARAYEN